MIDALTLLITLLKRFEGCRLHAYRDIAGVWTIGYGETLGVCAGMVWTQDEADSRLYLRALQFLMATGKACPVLMNYPHRWAAATCLSYNIGMGAFRASSVSRLSKRGEWQRAADSFWLWNKAGGKVVNGLTRRRTEERQVYLAEIVQMFNQ